jgi:hypothetical protein
MHKSGKSRIRRHLRMGLAAGVSGLGGAGIVLLGPAAAAVLGGGLLLAVVAFAWAVVFSVRDEPFQRLLALVKAFWRDR